MRIYLFIILRMEKGPLGTQFHRERESHIIAGIDFSVTVGPHSS